MEILETTRGIDVSSLDAEHRRALDDLIGAELQGNQRLVIRVTEADGSPVAVPNRKAQSVSDWARVYEGLREEEVEAIDEQTRTRADLTRRLP